ncbi:MAG: peptidylprolyl isomerase [Sedimentisphaerales bacterium]|nr:peptidylprolyl isomerase [Sedimentisphaerales bacterium]
MAIYINGEKIDDETIQAEMDRLAPQYEQLVAKLDTDEGKRQLYEWSKENLIEQVLVRQAARQKIKNVSAEQIDHVFDQAVEHYGSQDEFLKQNGLGEQDIPNIRKDIEERIKIESFLKKIMSEVPDPSEKQIRKYYESNSDRFAVPEMITASHIVKHPKQGVDPETMRSEMEMILEKIHGGADFAEIAEEYSDCPDNGGSLGSFAKGMMVEAFDDVVFNMEQGQVSDIFETEFGFHIAKVIDKKPSIPCPLDDVREIIVRDMKAEAEQKAIEKFVDNEKEKVVIEEK